MLGNSWNLNRIAIYGFSNQKKATATVQFCGTMMMVRTAKQQQ
jgi:hypothetical protein